VGASADFAAGIEWAQNGAAGLPVSIQIGSTTLNVAPIVLSGNTSASELWFEAGNANGDVTLQLDHGVPLAGRRLQSTTTSVPALLTMLPGSPTVHMVGLRLVGPLRVHGGRLEIHGCHVVNGSFADMGSAIAVFGGELHLSASEVRHNQDGVAVTGGVAFISHTRITDNVGTALRVDGGSVVLSNETTIFRNAHAMKLLSGSVTYQLPVPLGYWVSAGGSGLAVLQPGEYDGDVRPHARKTCCCARG
jgi:hypothetical protein